MASRPDHLSVVSGSFASQGGSLEGSFASLPRTLSPKLRSDDRSAPFRPGGPTRPECDVRWGWPVRRCLALRSLGALSGVPPVLPATLPSGGLRRGFATHDGVVPGALTLLHATPVPVPDNTGKNWQMADIEGNTTFTRAEGCPGSVAPGPLSQHNMLYCVWFCGSTLWLSVVSPQ